MQERVKDIEKDFWSDDWTPLQKILIGKGQPQDFPEGIKKPEVLAKWINDAARESEFTTMTESRGDPVVVTVTGGAGSIAYSLLPRILSGEMLGPNQPIHLKLLDLPGAGEKAMEGVKMELEDMAYPLTLSIETTSDVKKAFDGTNFAILLGSKPRTKGMERGDLLRENANIFAEQGKALNEYAHPKVRVCVVGNPANTNALIASANAPSIPKDQITALTRLDHDRGLAQIAQKLEVPLVDVHQFGIWGNHSATQYPDVSYVTYGTGKGHWALSKLDQDWVRGEFQTRVQNRGAEIINVMGKSSASSAADATLKHMRDWALGNNEWVSMAVCSTGQYGVPRDLWCSFPIVCRGGGQIGVIEDLPISQYSAEQINKSIKELLQEREAVKDLLPNPVHRFTVVPKEKIYTEEYLIAHSHPDKILGKEA